MNKKNKIVREEERKMWKILEKKEKSWMEQIKQKSYSMNWYEFDFWNTILLFQHSCPYSNIFFGLCLKSLNNRTISSNRNRLICPIKLYELNSFEIPKCLGGKLTKTSGDGRDIGLKLKECSKQKGLEQQQGFTFCRIQHIGFDNLLV